MKKNFVFIILILYISFGKSVSQELIVNGNFNSGNVGITSDYTYEAGSGFGQGSYTITDNPQKFHPGFAPCGDHTNDVPRMMMIFDSFTTPNKLVWSQNVNVEKNKSYKFSMWGTKLVYYEDSDLEIRINGIAIAKPFHVGGNVSCIWSYFEAIWCSEKNVEANIQIYNLTLDGAGNDLAIDDLSFMMTSSNDCPTGLSVPNIFCNNVLCQGDDLMLFADSVSGAKYFWSGPDNFLSNKRNSIIKNATAKNSGTYSLYIEVDGKTSDTVYFDVTVNKKFLSPIDSSLVYLGSAIRENEYIKLTESKKLDIGAVWLKKRFSVKKDFVTSFQFIISKGNNGILKENSVPGADGFAFVIHNSDKPSIGQEGGDMGFSGIPNSIAIEYDMFENPYDPNGNHIAIQSMGIKPNIANHLVSSSTLAMNDTIDIINQNTLYFSKIEYLWNSKILNIYLNNDSIFTTPVLKLNNFDLTSFLNLEEGEYMYVGFSAGTGEAFQEHKIKNWVVPCNEPTNVGVDDKFDFGNSMKLSISPNPVNEKFEIDFDLAFLSTVNLTLMDITGKVIKNILENEIITSGHNNIQVLTENINQGIYLLKLQTPTEQIIKKVLIIK